MSTKHLAATGLAGALACLTVSAHAAQPYQEYRKHIESAQTITALTDELMGDSISLYNGATEFTVTDINLPGNNALPVQLSRRFSVEITPGGSPGSTAGDPSYRGAGNWDIEVPYISATWTQGNWASNRCSSTPLPNVPLPLDPTDVWQGNTAHIPGAGDRKLLGLPPTGTPRPSDGAAWKWTTRERDMVRCIPMQSGLAGEGFLLQTSDGIKYYFDRATTRYAGSMSYQANSWFGGTISRTRYYLLASKIEDRFGNTVSYAYNASGHPTSISSSDGRQITLAYASGRLSSATFHDAVRNLDRTWTYGYGTSGDNTGMLTSVAQPDGSTWGYGHVGTLFPDDGGVWDGGSGPSCNVKPPAVVASFTFTAVHPSKAVGTFQFGNMRHPRSGVHMSACAKRIAPESSEIYYKLSIPNYFDVMSLSRKTLSGPALATRTWTYTYPFGSVPLWGSGAPAYPCTSCPAEKAVSVQEPDGTTKRYGYGYLYAVNEGRLLSTTTLDTNGAVRRVETTEYVSESEAPSQAFYGYYGVYGIGYGADEPSSRAIRPQIARVITQDGTDFVWAVAQGCGGAAVFCFDQFARPTKVMKTSLAAGTGDVVRPSGVPTLMAPDDSTTGSYTTSWTPVPFANRYQLQERLGSGSWATVQDGAGTSKAFSGKANGSWSYQVRACNALGCAGWSGIETVDVAVPPSSAPTLTAPGTNSSGSYTISWTPVARATRYELDQNANGSGWGPLYNGSGTSASRSGMLSGTYQYRVRACNTGGCGPYDTATTVVTRTTPVPPAPLNLTAPSQVEPFTAFTVSWGASSGATGYRLERSRNSGAWSLAYEGSARTTSQTLGLGTYLYRVQACNDGGCGLYSSGATVLVKAVALVPDEVDGE